jgi:hypothetical protein
MKIAIVETEAKIGEVIPENKIETGIRRIASSVLIPTEARIGQKKS